MSTQTKEQVMKQFMQDMDGSPASALNTSFRKYSELRDELIVRYSKLTGIAPIEFSNEIADVQAKSLSKFSW
jgi:hypothetical protein